MWAIWHYPLTIYYIVPPAEPVEADRALRAAPLDRLRVLGSSRAHNRKLLQWSMRLCRV